MDKAEREERLNSILDRMNELDKECNQTFFISLNKTRKGRTTLNKNDKTYYDLYNCVISAIKEIETINKDNTDYRISKYLIFFNTSRLNLILKDYNALDNMVTILDSYRKGAELKLNSNWTDFNTTAKNFIVYKRYFLIALLFIWFVLMLKYKIL